MSKAKKEKLEEREECKICLHLESSRDYYHEKYHAEQRKVKTLIATVAMLSEALKEANDLIDVLDSEDEEN